MAKIRSTKFQAPNIKQTAIYKISKFKQNPFGHLELEFGVYLGFEFWDLEFYAFELYTLCVFSYLTRGNITRNVV
jgi:hypothetical protein